ncbi:hypothetical protein [Paraburkholderia saeva]|uniref:hypothetical protein n=1 Tax=Paraburkholderia saeva TaxID=2777537 RepID=UPI001D27825A|nr:hypothetical protein [Paraburkholderia saeva]CAG4900310.1 hypothetical protein R52603_02724 [Paraburkholderia saeva]
MKTATLTTAATPPPSRADLAQYASRRIACKLLAHGADYGSHPALYRLVCNVIEPLAAHPHNRITAIELSNFEDLDEPVTRRLFVLVELATGHMFAASLPAARAQRMSRREAHQRVRGFAAAMATQLDTDTRHVEARERQRSFHLIPGDRP